MPVTVLIPTPLRELTGRQREVAARGATVRQVLADLAASHPELGARLTDERGEPRRHLGLFLNDVDVRTGGGMDAPVGDGDRLTLVPALAGGAPALGEAGIARWARQLLVPGFGAAGQERLLASRVRVIGADGLAGTALLYLAQAGIGTIWIDDPETTAPADAGGWLLGPRAVGQPRGEAAVAALRPFSSLVTIAPYPIGGVPTAVLILASSSAQALATAEVARRTGVPHVVVEADAEGGTVASIPVGAPCYACARGAAGAGRPPAPAAAAVAALAAQELLQLIADPALQAGRRFELIRGVPSVRATARITGCACHPTPPADAGEGDAQG